MSAFFIQLSLVSVMLSRRAQRTQKALRTEEHIKNFFSERAQRVQSGKGCTHHSMIDFGGGSRKF